MTLIRPNAEPPVTAVLSGDGFLIDGSTGVRFLAEASVAYTANSLAQFAATTSAQLRAVLSDETGAGSAVFAISPVLVTPSLVTPSLGVATATSINGNTITAGTGVLTLAAAKTLTANNTLTLAGTDGTTQTFPSTSGTVVTSVSSNVVTNGMRAQMAAWTLKGNATSGTANEADIDVTALTLKSAPVSGDIVLIQDSAASNAFKKTTVGALASAGSVASIAGNTGAFTLTKGLGNVGNAIGRALNEATFQSGVLSPTGTTNTSGVMMGMGSTCTITPVYSTRIKISVTGQIASSSAGQFASASLRYGTGTAPANAAALAGTNVSNVAATSTGAGQALPFALNGIVTGLTPGTAYWIDLGVVSSVGTSGASAASVFVSAEEF
jgi:hypothetical protein